MGTRGRAWFPGPDGREGGLFERAGISGQRCWGRETPRRSDQEGCGAPACALDAAVCILTALVMCRALVPHRGRVVLTFCTRGWRTRGVQHGPSSNGMLTPSRRAHGRQLTPERAVFKMPSAVDPWADAGSLSPYRLDMDHDGEVSHKEMRKHNKLNGAARVGYSMPASTIAVCRFSRVCYGVLRCQMQQRLR